MSDQPKVTRAIKEPSYADAVIPLVLLALLISSSIALFGLAATSGPLQVALLLTAVVTAGIVMKNGHPWEEVAASASKGIASVSTAIFILLAVGALIGTWNLSGTIPTMVYYGIQWISPDWFYVATLFICGAIALGIGSSWTTAGTIGVGLVGLSLLLGLSPAVTAGAVISGAYLGDKLSPLSETTILTAQLVKLDIYTHLRAQVWTSVPAFLIAAVVFTVIGLVNTRTQVDASALTTELDSLEDLFWITPLNLIPLVFLVLASIRKVPPSLAIMGSALLAGLMAAILQPSVVLRFVDSPALSAPAAYLKGAWMAMANGFVVDTGSPAVDMLLSRGGMDSMLLTIWLIIGAISFGTLLDQFGLLSKLITPILLRAQTTGKLVATVAATALGLNIIAGDQYIAVVLPARMFQVEFHSRGLAPQNLSRTCADAGTVTSPLVPWNSCGAYMSAVLGVPTLAYLPYCIFNIASPLLTVLYGFTGFKVTRMTAEVEAPRSLPT